MADELKYQRILLKLSGEALGPQGTGIEADEVRRIAREVQRVHKLGIEIAVVIGGGNIWRGADAAATGIDRGTADYVGMLATVMNALVLQDAMEKLGMVTRVQTAIRCLLWLNHLFVAARCVIWRKGESLFSPLVAATLSLLPILLRRYGRSN